MKHFNSKLEIGQPAMIIGTRQPKNSWLIGSVVTVEGFCVAGQDVTNFYVGSAEAGRRVIDSGSGKTAVISGSKVTGSLSHGFPMHTGWTMIDSNFLMPLPPLDEKQLTKHKELERS